MTSRAYQRAHKVKLHLAQNVHWWPLTRNHEIGHVEIYIHLYTVHVTAEKFLIENSENDTNCTGKLTASKFLLAEKSPWYSKGHTFSGAYFTMNNMLVLLFQSLLIKWIPLGINCLNQTSTTVLILWSFGTCCIDSCNSFLCKLQRIQYSAAWLVPRSHKSIIWILRNLHWLP